MDAAATAVQQQQRRQQQHRPLFDATTATNFLKPRISSSNGTAFDANKGNKGVAPDHPAALRAGLKHRATPPPPSSSSNNSSSCSSAATATTTATAYDRVLDTARRLAELESQRAQDQIYIRTLEQTRATLMRDAQSAARARAEAERAVGAERDARGAMEEMRAERDEAVRVAGAERERAEGAEGRVRVLEGAVREGEERVRVLEGAVDGERRRREEWESGIEALVY